MVAVALIALAAALVHRGLAHRKSAAELEVEFDELLYKDMPPPPD